MATLRLNQVVLGGNLTRDPVLRRLASGNSVAEFGLAIDDGYTSKTGEPNFDKTAKGAKSGFVVNRRCRRCPASQAHMPQKGDAVADRR